MWTWKAVLGVGVGSAVARMDRDGTVGVDRGHSLPIADREDEPQGDSVGSTPAKAFSGEGVGVAGVPRCTVAVAVGLGVVSCSREVVGIIEGVGDAVLAVASGVLA
jgi:hypothetical protein